MESDLNFLEMIGLIATALVPIAIIGAWYDRSVKRERDGMQIARERAGTWTRSVDQATTPEQRESLRTALLERFHHVYASDSPYRRAECQYLYNAIADLEQRLCLPEDQMTILPQFEIGYTMGNYAHDRRERGLSL